MITFRELHQIAASLGVTLTRHTGGRAGWYDHGTRTISTRRGQTAAQYRSVLAHELGHATHGDEATGLGYFDARAERRADQYAANLLITQDAYAQAEATVGPYPGAIADELEVTQHLLRVWCEQHHPGTTT